MATLRIQVARAGQAVQSIDEDEGYSLVVDSVHATLHAETVVGALRGMETVVQLLTLRDGRYVLPAVTVTDAPRFRWRGLLIDVGRHFIPVEGIKRTLDGMAAVKLNVLHWHLTEDQGFRVESKRYPKLQTLGSDGEFYTQEQIREVVGYARDRGIRIVPEFDMPSHSTTWFIGYPQLASIPGKYQIVRTYGAGDASFDPTREETYHFIDRFIGEMVPLFPDPYWHVGGDEVTDKHWNKSARVRAFKRRRKMRKNDQLQAYFNQRLTAILRKYKKRMVGWDEILHPGLPKNSVIQSWRADTYFNQSSSQGYQSLQSTPYYLDHIKTAEEHYMADIDPPWSEMPAAQRDMILGGEACMWTEHVNAETIDSRIWPRLGPIAERFWSPREVNSVDDMYRRMNALDEQLGEFDIGRTAHIQHLVHRMTTDDRVREATVVMLEAVAPPTFGQRIRGQGTTQLTPLVHLIDAAVPDPWGRWETIRLVNALLADSLLDGGRSGSSLNATEARAQLTALLTRWRDVLPAILDGSVTSPFIAEGLPAAEALARASTIGLEALGYIGTGQRSPQGWGDSLLMELTDLEQPHNLLRIQIVGPIRRLVSAAAINSH
jgi:hexosaminidase